MSWVLRIKYETEITARFSWQSSLSTVCRILILTGFFQSKLKYNKTVNKICSFFAKKSRIFLINKHWKLKLCIGKVSVTTFKKFILFSAFSFELRVSLSCKCLSISILLPFSESAILTFKCAKVSKYMIYLKKRNCRIFLRIWWVFTIKTWVTLAPF